MKASLRLPPKKNRTDDQDRKRGRGSQAQFKVLVMVESEPVGKEEQKKDRPNRKAGHLRMLVIPDLERGTLDMNEEKWIEKDAEILTNAFPAYSLLS